MSLLVKRAADPDGRARLRREADVLQRARHPGVVGPAVLDEEDDATVLALPRLAAPTLAEEPPADPRAARRVAAAVARTVADLHAVGVAHRALRADHVLLDDGRPVLCGFGDATTDATDADRHGDETALASLVELLAASAAGRGDRTARRAGAALRRVAVAARAANPPLSAAALARRLADGAGGALSRPAAPRRPALPPLPRRVAALLAVPVVVVLAVALGTRRTHEPDDPAGATPTTTPASSTSSAPITSSTSSAPSPSAAPAVTPTVEAGGVRYAAGAPGDRAVVGDWTCTGTPSVLLLRPDTGELWLFPALPFGDETVPAVVVATVPGARDVDRDAAATRCPKPSVVDGTGRRIEVEAR